MNTTDVANSRDEADAVVAAATAGDESAFSELFGRYRRELHVHCYRMLGSFEESEDVVQETFLRAWRRRATFEGRSTFRAWLYRIATNATLDVLSKDPKRVPPHEGAGPPPADLPWLQPYPDRLLEELATTEAEPEAALVSKETIELTYLVAIQYLPPKQRAVLILRDVLSWSAKDAASLLDTSPASVNSALQRARAALKKHLPERRLEWAPGSDPSKEERALLQRYIEATDQADAQAFVDMLREDARFSMPPEPGVWVGAERIVGAWAEGGAFDLDTFGHMRGLATRANMQPAVACYHRPPGESEHRAMALDVLRIEEGAVAEIVTFPPTVFAAFALPQKV
jgi:RNA polymerase sigma-70 factor, ECF subfamily